MFTACTKQTIPDDSKEQIYNENTMESNPDLEVQNSEGANTKNEVVKEEEPGESGRELTREELKSFTNIINSNENYGFLLSEYTSPEGIDLNQVFYNGAGIEAEKLSEEEEKTYLNVIGTNQIATDYVRLTTRQIDGFLQEKMGITLVDVKVKLDWTYLEDYDIWISQHGDTNYVSFTCASGKQIEEDMFLLECATEDEYISDCQITLRKTGDAYQFVSNQYINKIQNANAIRQIDDQTFLINLDGWGEVTFAAYEPDTSIFLNTDATFALLKGEETLFTFPGLEENNQRGNFIFNDILAVAFKDYNNDSMQDVIIINEYEAGSGPTVAQSFHEVRLYTQHGGNKEYVLDRDTTDYINSEGYNSNISQVVEEAKRYLVR